jgi:DNA mismatch repair protein MutS
MGIITDYLNEQVKYTDKYGQKTVVLMQIGIFYEIYEYDPNNCSSEEAKRDKEGKIWNQRVGHAVYMSEALNSILTFENGNEPYSINNPNKVGFPMVAYEKNKNTILSHDFVIVRIDQVKDAFNNVSRVVAEVCHPSLQMDTLSFKSTNNIVMIYLEYQDKNNIVYQNNITNLDKTTVINFDKPTVINFDKSLVTVGIASVDIFTGNNKISEFYSKTDDEVFAIQEIFRLLLTLMPREILVYIDNIAKDIEESYKLYINKNLELYRFDRVSFHINNIDPEFRKISYQVDFFNKIFTSQVTNKIVIINKKIIEELELERYNYGRLAYVLLLQHCYSHDTTIISKLSKPDLHWIDSDNHLILTHNAILQLNIINVDISNKHTYNSLLAVIDSTSTKLGRRKLEYLLQNPMLKAQDINKYYAMIDEMQKTHNDHSDPLWLILDKMLKDLPDIEKLHRKLEIGSITPKYLVILYNAYIKIINIYIIILKCNTPILQSQLFTPEEIANFNTFIQKFARTWQNSKFECCNIITLSETKEKCLEFTENPLLGNNYPDVDTQNAYLITCEKTLQNIIDHLNYFLEKSRGTKITIRENKKKQGAKNYDPADTVLVTSSAKANILLNSAINVELCGNITISTFSTSETIVTSEKIAMLCATIDNIKNYMRKRLFQIYELFIDETNRYIFFNSLHRIVALIDVIVCYAKISARYKYHKPEILEYREKSILIANELRHPIIEKLIDGKYIENDITLTNSGMLLYGVNQTGKSSLAKALALNLILAQAGCFTAAKLQYTPFTKIITRLSGNDNIFKGESSFAVEMRELRTILRQADNRTLVIGDELSRGTEHESGMAITASSILSLLERKSCFIFATHMHDLLNLPQIKKIDNSLKICHLSVSVDSKTKELIYERKIKDGSGARNYGLLVAESLNLPEEFINIGKDILNTILGIDKVVNTQKSKYNSSLYIDQCAKCSSKVNLHTHHIEEQKYADDKGFIGNMHKNVKDNLIVLCDDCHKDIHKDDKNNITIYNTANGKLVNL